MAIPDTQGVSSLKSPFDLNDRRAYQRWRDAKLAAYPEQATELFVDIQDSMSVSEEEAEQVRACIARANMAIFRFQAPVPRDKPVIQRFGAGFGLQHLDDNLCADEDSITSLQVVEEGRHKGYIPYTNRPISWHTDGYYNTPEQTVRAVLLYCVHPAARGGENLLLDHEIAYLLMRDEEPRWIEALMRADAMIIPPNIEQGSFVRGERPGPVFSVDARGRLHMRYTARTRSIVWANDTATREAVAFLRELMSEASPYVFKYRLNPGEGLICNNVLHTRTAFEDDPNAASRLLYRARYYDRVSGT